MRYSWSLTDSYKHLSLFHLLGQVYNTAKTIVNYPTAKKITIVSTQNYSDANAGHFAATLAASLNANYISNEFYSSGALLKEKQINFAINERFENMTCNENTPLNKFINDLKSLKNKTKLFIYIGTFRSLSDRKQDALLMFGGAKNEQFNVEKPTFKNLERLNEAYCELSKSFKRLGLTLGTHEVFENTDKFHLSKSISNNFAINTVSLYISTNVLWTEDESMYYSTLLALSDGIKKICE